MCLLIPLPSHHEDLCRLLSPWELIEWKYESKQLGIFKHNECSGSGTSRALVRNRGPEFSDGGVASRGPLCWRTWQNLADGLVAKFMSCATHCFVS